MHEAAVVGESGRIGAAQLHLHVGVDHARRQRDDARRVRAGRFLQRDRAAEMVHAGLGGAVGGAAGHRAPAQAGRDVEHPHLAAGTRRPAGGRAQQRGRQQHRRLQADTQRGRQRAGRILAQRADPRDHAGVVDQRDAAPARRRLRGQPGRQPRGRSRRVAQVQRPGQVLAAVSGGQRVQPRIGLARDAHQQQAGTGQQATRHRQPQAARGAGQDDEMIKTIERAAGRCGVGGGRVHAWIVSRTASDPGA